METVETWEAKNDLPHEEYMDDKNILYSQLPKSIQKAIKEFDKVYEKALKDGLIDEKEEKDIIHQSYEITQLLKKEYESKNTPKESGGNGVLGFLLGITLGVLGGAAIRNGNSV